MGAWPKFPVVYKINTWAWLHELSREAGEPVTLGNVPQPELERLANYHCDALWLMGVWERSPGARAHDLELPHLLASFRAVLPDYAPEDVVGSPYAVHRYQVDPSLGGDEGDRDARGERPQRRVVVGRAAARLRLHRPHDQAVGRGERGGLRTRPHLRRPDRLG